ncbi:sulfite oxidase heme-binding subunit YedZ [Propionivibrio soli]|uniref:sulfite oxidase heme-binding subunit YedZ n=1 Tax=Propionivibrio soli TaxID=2976531 RepID=UPI0021E7F225|nr:protein-methionine-sulfoxide reductase heme-binding subunit MsrQ [Propionivibrio soli]
MTVINAMRLSVFVASLGPLARLFWLGTHDGLSANPFEFVTRSTGTWALVFLCLSLSMTPLRRLTGRPQWVKFRRMLGLYCFFYAVLHFSLWFWVDHAFDLSEMWRDVLKRPFIAAGFTAFVLLIPLAATSTKGMMRRLGMNWVRLHRLVYVIAMAAILHYWWHKAGKNDFGTVSIYAAVVFTLLAMRVWWAVKARWQAGQRAAGRLERARPVESRKMRGADK